MLKENGTFVNMFSKHIGYLLTILSLGDLRVLASRLRAAAEAHHAFVRTLPSVGLVQLHPFPPALNQLPVSFYIENGIKLFVI